MLLFNKKKHAEQLNLLKFTSYIYLKIEMKKQKVWFFFLWKSFLKFALGFNKVMFSFVKEKSEC